MKKFLRDMSIGILVLIGIFVAITFNKSDTPGHSEIGAWVVCQNFVKKTLKSPATADFPSGPSQYTKSLGDGRYEINAYVDAENSFGANLRTQFKCVVEHAGGDENYRLVDLQLDE